MLTPRLLLSAVLALAALPGAALEWKAATLTFTTAPFQKTQDVVFEFRNTGPRPVTILDIQTNCECLDAGADQTVYAPGAGGAIKARFTIDERAGLYERLILVVTDEAPAGVRLLVRIEVPEIAAFSPRSVGWKLNGAADERFLELTPGPGLTIDFAAAQATNDAFTARLETLEPGRRYRLHLKPRSTTRPASAAIRVSGREKSGRDVVVSAYANIQ